MALVRQVSFSQALIFVCCRIAGLAADELPAAFLDEAKSVPEEDTTEEGATEEHASDSSVSESSRSDNSPSSSSGTQEAGCVTPDTCQPGLTGNHTDWLEGGCVV